MKKEILLLITSSLLSIAIALFAFSYFYPNLFGRPVDMEIVQLDKKLPPFYMGVFRANDIQSTDPILQDPITNVRGKPFLPEINKLGPHDVLGFRNSETPRITDVVTIGDSQTYGINAVRSENWPSLIEEQIAPFNVYNMSLGGFSAPQYLQLAEYAMIFKPQVLVLALYSGNDPLEAFRSVYNIDFWKPLRKYPELTSKDAPPSPFPPPKETWWPVTFPNGSSTVLTPEVRLSSHLHKYKAVRAGYEITLEILEKISQMAKVTGTPVVLTVIPTKELSYYPKVLEGKVTPPETYTQLIKAELQFIEQVKNKASILAPITYVDVTQSLQQAVLTSEGIYPSDKDGHPLPSGYKVIANTLLPYIEKHLKKVGDGFYRVTFPGSAQVWHFVVKDGRRWFISSPERLKETNYSSRKPVEVSFRLLERFPLAGVDDTQLPETAGH